MKKLLSLMGISLLALMLAVPAFASDKPIKVYINGSNVAFTAGSPYLKDNTVLVPFRVIFEQLGLNVLWDAKTGTVTGTSASLTISLKIGSSRATVNNLVKKLAAAPSSISGTTYIPLRFVAEATGGTAVWDTASRSVKINTPEASGNSEQQITDLMHLSNEYFNSENAAGYYSLVVFNSVTAGSVDSLQEYFKRYDMVNTIESLDILSIQGNEAVVHTVEKSVRKGGDYLPDERYEYLHTLVRKNGVWKIESSEVQDSSVLLTPEQGTTAAVLPQSDASAIKDSLSKYYAARNAKNVDGTLAQLTYYGEEYEASTKDALAEYFEAYNLTDTLNSSNIFYYTPDEAAIYVESSVKDADSGESYTQSSIFIVSKSSSGQWTIDDSYMVSYSDDK
ncbi:copper amine oxidase N-terminal domain-containing protein [Paenibacillus jilunlii]|uniref:Copper amine oxidase N-terminal domain-containing protein n=1 Tax=Paenibacillus jilunlii TaxID=682956 RepID=A0A1G9QRU3_9BACL|nr:copper amine oxidase N-terminal domain-containing protein [Paenibacillus jilunlii]SDM13714.1 Copper amine oxidase N-terminal domain-containing protein [Paenibacillus jilunlii]